MEILRFGVVAALLLAAAQPIRGQTPQTGDLASWTIQKVVRDAEENKRAKTRITYRESSVEEEYSTDNVLKSRKANTRTIDGSAKSKVAGFELDLYEILANTYNFRLANTGSATGLTVIGDKVYIAIDFAPKERLRFRNLTDRFVQQLRGRIWVDVGGDHYFIYRMEGVTPEFSFTYWKWGIIPIPITIKNLRLSFNQERLESGMVVEKSAEATVIFDSLQDGRREYRYTFDNFQNK